LVIVSQLVRCPGSTTPFFRHTKLNGPVPETTVLKFAVVPAQLAKLVSAVAVTLVLLTVTVNVHVDVLPCASVAVLVTVVVPTGNAKPLGGTLVTLGTAQLLLAVTVNVTLLLQAPGAAVTVMFAGQVICGT
jgi:hypothetical protein